MIYLDNSATSFPKPKEVYDFMDNFYRVHGVSPGRAGYDAGIETGELLTDTRRLLSSLFNGGAKVDERRLTFSYNATDSLNILIQSLAQKGGSDMPKEESGTKEGDTRQQVCPATRARKATTYLIKLD